MCRLVYFPAENYNHNCMLSSASAEITKIVLNRFFSRQVLQMRSSTQSRTKQQTQQKKSCQIEDCATFRLCVLMHNKDNDEFNACTLFLSFTGRKMSIRCCHPVRGVQKNQILCLQRP
ncbi:hypothetical protein SRHO_G00166180, partial [Serrasalmus rhombeus]